MWLKKKNELSEWSDLIRSQLEADQYPDKEPGRLDFVHH